MEEKQIRTIGIVNLRFQRSHSFKNSGMFPFLLCIYQHSIYDRTSIPKDMSR